MLQGYENKQITNKDTMYYPRGKAQVIQKKMEFKEEKELKEPAKSKDLPKEK